MTGVKKSKILGVGFYVPPRIVTNHDLSKVMTTSDEWITQRTGIKERRYVDAGVSNADLAKEASLEAIRHARITAEDIDFIIYATLSPDYFFPGSGCLLQEKLGLHKKEIGALDIRTQCTGFVYALSIADQYIKSGMYKHILVVGSEIHSTGLDFTDRGRDVAVLFGDGAGAAVVGVTEDTDRGILSTHLHADGSYARELWTESPSSTRHPRISKTDLEEARHYPYMNGKKVFVHAVKKFQDVIKEGLEKNGKTIKDISLFIPHQANQRISEAVADSLEIPMSNVFCNIYKYGNTTAGSIPIALSEAFQEKRIQEGDLVVLAAFGAGFTWASAIIKW